MPIPVYSTHGSIAAGLLTAPLQPGWPATVTAGDVLYLHVMHQAGTIPAASPITGATEFDLLINATSTGAAMRHWIYRRVALGSETGNIAGLFMTTATASNAFWRAVIHRFTGMTTTTGYEDGVGSILSGSSINPGAPTVTSLGPNRLAVAFGAQSWTPTAPITSYTGETGGDWLVEFDTVTAGSTAQNTQAFLQTAALASSGILSGGQITTTSSAVWLVSGLSLVGATTSTSTGSGPQEIAQFLSNARGRWLTRRVR